MKTYARIEDGTVLEMLSTDTPPSALFHAALAWTDVTGKTVGIGWRVAEDGSLSAPQPQAGPAPIVPATIAALQADLARISARLGALKA